MSEVIMANNENGGFELSPPSTKKRRQSNSYLDTSEADLEIKKPKREDYAWTEEMDLLLIKYVEESCEKLQSGNGPKYIMTKNIKWSAISERFYAENAQKVEADTVKTRWEDLAKKVRKIRTVPEILEDVKQYVNCHMDLAPKKKPLSAYQLFCSSKRSRISEKYPNLAFSDLSRRLGKKWKELPAEKKAKYEGKALKLKDKYEEEVKQWQSENPEAASLFANEKNNGKTKMSKISQCEVTPYEVFCKEKSPHLKAKHPDLDDAGIQGKLKKRWEKLKDSKRKDYTEEASSINSKAKDTIKVEEEKKSRKKAKTAKKKDPLNPKKPQSAYILYYLDERQKLLKANPELAFTTISKMIGKSWKEVSEEVSSHYKEQAEASKQNYLQKLKELEEKKHDSQ